MTRQERVDFDTVKIYAVVHPDDYAQYAMVSITGTWASHACAVCGRKWSRYADPLLVGKHKGSSRRLAEFSWSLNTPVVTLECAEKLRSTGLELDYGSVQLHRPASPTEALQQEPFVSREFFWLRPRTLIPLNCDASKLKERVHCEACGYIKAEFRLHDLVVDKASVGDLSAFGFHEFGLTHLFMTEVGVARFRSLEWENVRIKEAGYVA